MTEDQSKPNRAAGARRLDGLPGDIIARCRQMAKDIRQQNDTVRDAKVLEARTRICSGYYDSDHVPRVIASRMLSGGPPR